jgi:predicted nucleic acid-binding protein/predicted HTH domain antitoxin
MKVTLTIPEDASLKPAELPVYVAAKMYEDGILSAGQAAEMAGLSKRAFIEIMGKYGVSVFSTSVNDLLNDIENAWYCSYYRHQLFDCFFKTWFIFIIHALYSEVIITEEIALEFDFQLPQWIKVVSVKNHNYQKILETILDRGESSAIALGLEYTNPLLIIDDLKARKEALKMGFKITGTLGLLVKAREKGIIEKLKPQLEKLQSAGFRISDKIITEMLKQVKE